MKLSEIKSLVNQPVIPQRIQNEIISLAADHIDRENDVDVVVGINTITLEAYEFGVRVEIVERNFAKNNVSIIYADEDL